MNNKLKIIGGKWRSRLISFPDTPGLRPTPSRVRETLFNWLQYDLAGNNCLDLFAGSGALGIEAASRGANQVVQVDNNPKAIQFLNDNKALLEANTIKVIHQDASSFLHQRSEPFDLVFMDPPFGSDKITDTCRLLEQQGWLSKFAKIYIECERQLQLTGLPLNWNCLKQKKAGDVSYQLFNRIV